MDHVAIMKKSWHLLEKIISGEKTIESRWYKNRSRPWNQISPGDKIYFKDSGEPVTLKARVTKVLQFSDLTPEKTKAILKKYGQKDLGITKNLPKDLKAYFENKKYCLLVFLGDVQKVKPFKIDKTGFGAMSAWIRVEDIKKIKK
jgi:ASC-1-like (ASCH) protein